MLPATNRYTSDLYDSWASTRSLKMYADNAYYRQNQAPQFAEDLRGELDVNQPGSSVLGPNMATREGVINSANNNFTPAATLRLSGAAVAYAKRLG